MDVYLSRDAFLSIKALGLISSNSNFDGLLIGHKRGHRFFVKKIFLSVKGFFPSKEKYLLLNELFDDSIIGFFSFNPDEKKIRKILAPFAFGKVFLDIRLDRQKRININPFVIEYEEEFFLFPIQLKS